MSTTDTLNPFEPSTRRFTPFRTETMTTPITNPSKRIPKLARQILRLAPGPERAAKERRLQNWMQHRLGVKGPQK